MERTPKPMTSSQARACRCRARIERRIDCALHIPYQRAEVKPEFTRTPVLGFIYNEYDIAMFKKFTKDLSHPFVPMKPTIPSLRYLAAYEASREMLNNKVLILEYNVEGHPYYEALKHQLEDSDFTEIVQVQANWREKVKSRMFTTIPPPTRTCRYHIWEQIPPHFQPLTMPTIVYRAAIDRKNALFNLHDSIERVVHGMVFQSNGFQYFGKSSWNGIPTLDSRMTTLEFLNSLRGNQIPSIYDTNHHIRTDVELVQAFTELKHNLVELTISIHFFESIKNWFQSLKFT